ncbi:MAG: AAA family ATPase [Gammaproteobacteria bacterium]|nr:AAA family ATPase [Gammaproteobacteria bacterium]
MYVALEGIDGCGKSTQVDRLMSSALSPVEQVRLPYEHTTEFFARLPREHLGRSLAFAADCARLMPFVREHLRAGRHVISDRSMLSSWAYQFETRRWDLTHLVRMAVDGIRLDAVILLCVPPEEAFARSGERAHPKVVARYQQMFGGAPQTVPEWGRIMVADFPGGWTTWVKRFYVVNGVGHPHDVHLRVLDVLEDVGRRT